PQCALSCIEDARTQSTDCSYGDLNCLCTGENGADVALGSTPCMFSACGRIAALSAPFP
ncbi:hypothetical protein B0T26DRAFT_607477, partial [Lasiosphaeria miniovina]